MAKSTFRKLSFELSTFGVLVIGILYLVVYYAINKSLPEVTFSFNLTIPITLIALGGIVGNISALINKYRMIVNRLI